MFHIGILCYSVLFRTQSSFGQFAFRAPVERNGAFLNCGVASAASVASHIEKRPLIACRESDLRSLAGPVPGTCGRACPRCEVKGLIMVQQRL